VNLPQDTILSPMQDLSRDIVGLVAGMLGIRDIHALVDSLVLPDTTMEWLVARHACLICKEWTIESHRLCPSCYNARTCNYCGRTYMDTGRVVFSIFDRMTRRCRDPNRCKICRLCLNGKVDILLGLATYKPVGMCYGCYGECGKRRDQIRECASAFSN
jgi:hypothetical protein